MTMRIIQMKSTLDAISQKYPDKKQIIIFQPHTFSRTKEFADDLVNIFKDTYKTFILDIHPAREKQEDYPEVTSEMIIDKLDNCEHINVDEYEKLAQYDNAVFAFMSPNDISKLEKELISHIQD